MSDRSVDFWDDAYEDERTDLPPGVKLVRTLRWHKGHFGNIAWSPNGRMLASSSLDNTILILNSEKGMWLKPWERHSDIVDSVAFDPASRVIASGSHDKTVKLWDADSGQLLRTLEGH